MIPRPGGRQRVTSWRLFIDMNLQSNDFELFGIPQQFAQNRDVLDARWKELQRQAHPDRFAAQGGAAQRVAMQWSVRVNEAYRRLKDPLKRAAYLCELNGAPVNAENNTAMPAAFLMQQMQWREALEEACGLADLEELAEQVAQARRASLQACGAMIDQAQDFEKAVGQVRALMCIERFAQEVDIRLDAFHDRMDTAGGGQ